VEVVHFVVELDRVVIALNLNRECDSRLDRWRTGIAEVEDRAVQIRADVVGNLNWFQNHVPLYAVRSAGRANA